MDVSQDRVQCASGEGGGGDIFRTDVAEASFLQPQVCNFPVRAHPTVPAVDSSTDLV